MRRMVAGLRGRLLLALVATSLITLGAGLTVILGPLQTRLRDQSADNLEAAVLAARPRFERALQRESEDARRRAAADAAFELQDQTDARVLVGEDVIVTGGVEPATYLYDTQSAAPGQATVLLTLRAQRLRETVIDVDGDDLRVVVPLFGRRDGVLVAERRLTEVTNAAGEVRNAFLAASLVGLGVAIALAVALSGTLLRRLDRLRRVALRITDEGPDAPAPRDSGRDEVGDLARALALMQEGLRRQEAARRAFVATASHELRTPLTMLLGTVELLEEDLRDGRLDEADAQRHVASARRELLRMSALAGELLDLSRLDAAVQLRSEPVELGELARAVAAEFELRAQERRLTLEVVPPAGPCWARGDPDAVARVVRILLDNALRYGPAGEPVRIAAGNRGGQAVVEVADRGPGVPPEEREEIFERFHRGRTATAESGFGLGLAIGRELAQRMGGTLELGSEGPGARFWLALPPAPDRDGTPAPAPARGAVRVGP